jgi:hypothetical protein
MVAHLYSVPKLTGRSNFSMKVYQKICLVQLPRITSDFHPGLEVYYSKSVGIHMYSHCKAVMIISKLSGLPCILHMLGSHAGTIELWSKRAKSHKWHAHARGLIAGILFPVPVLTEIKEPCSPVLTFAASWQRESGSLYKLVLIIQNCTSRSTSQTYTSIHLVRPVIGYLWFSLNFQWLHETWRVLK